MRKIVNSIIFQFCGMYAWLQYFCHEYLHMNIRGFGFALRQIRGNRIIDVQGVKFFLDSRIGVSYLRLVGGIWNEPETHTFLEKLIKKAQSPVTFIDVGANIGEMVLDVARFSNVTQTYAVEPIEECANAIKKSAKINGFKNFKVICNALSNKPKDIFFSIDTDNIRSSFLSNEHKEGFKKLMTSTLDIEFENLDSNLLVILLIDAEGEELNIVKGGKELIKKLSPIIIFEYHNITRTHFDLKEMKYELGKEYEIFRLRRDGLLDSELERTWNCVAVKKDTEFFEMCKNIVKYIKT